MKVIVLVKATTGSEAGEMPSEQLLADMGNYNEELVAAGIMQAGEGLKPSSEAVRVRFSGASRTVIAGPFAETNELVAGYWVWEVSSMQEAIDWVKRCPNPMNEDSDIEIRPVFSMDDFATVDRQGEIANQENVLRAKMAMQQSTLQPYLFLSGRCEEAIAFYEKSLDAKLVMKMRFSESPDPVPEGMLQAGFEHKIMHASLNIGRMTIMLSDGCDDQSKFSGFRLALSVPDESAADSAFHALAEGGKVEMPMVKTFWSPRYGMVTDKFGVGWMVMVPGEPG